MRKLIAAVAFLFLSAFAFAQTTAVVTGNLIDQSETGTSSGISLDVTLVNTGSQRCFVNGTGTLVKEKANYTAAQVLAGITLAKTANITCGATSGQTRWRFTFKNAALNTARDCDLQISGATSLNTATCLQAATTPTTTVPTANLFLLLDGSNSMTGNLVPAVNGTQSIGTSGSRWSMFANTLDVSGTSNLSGNTTVGGTLGVTGATSTCILNGVRMIGSSCYASIAACLTAASAGETCQAPPNWTETLGANVVFNKKKTTLRFMGGCAITLNGFNFQVAQGTDDVSIISPFAHSSDQGGNNQGCMFVGYTGSGAAIDIGSSAGFTYNTLIRGIAVDLFSAQANAIAYRLTNGVQDVLDDDTCVEGPVSGQKCFATVGTGAFFAGLNRILSPECTAAAGATNNFCIQLGTISNDNTIIGGHANILGSGANNSVCIDVSGSTSGNNQLYGFDCDTGVTAVTVESTVSRGIYAVINVDSGVTNGANFAASSLGNTVIINANLPVTDNGVAGTNSYINPARFGWRTDKLQWMVESGFALLNNAATTAPFDVWIYGGDRRVNADTGANTVKLAWDQGTGGVAFGKGDGSTTVAQIDSTGKFSTYRQVTNPTARVVSDFTTANNTSLQTITGLSWTFPAVAGNYSFHCALLYSQATAAVADQFGIQVATNAPTNVAASAVVYTSVSASAMGTLATLSTTTATAIATFTPSAITTVWQATIDGTFELPASANTVNIMVQTSNGADAVTVKRGSYCQLF